MAKKKRSTKNRQEFRNKAWTYSEVAALYEGNAEFRAVAKKCLRVVTGKDYDGAGKIDRYAEQAKQSGDPAFDLAIAMIDLSTQVGSVLAVGKTDYFPHPAVVMAWIINIAALGGKDVVGRDFNREGFGARLLAPLISAFRMPSAIQSDWIRFWRDARKTVNSRGIGHMFTASVEPLPAPTNGMVRGFRVKSVTIRVPNGMEVHTEKNAERRQGKYFAPPRIQRLRIEFAALANELGEVWIGIGDDSRTAFFASEKKGKFSPTDLLERAKLVDERTDDISKMPFSTLGDRIGQRMQTPIPAIAQRLQQQNLRQQTINLAEVQSVDPAVGARSMLMGRTIAGAALAGVTRATRAKIEIPEIGAVDEGLKARLAQLRDDAKRAKVSASA